MILLHWPPHWGLFMLVLLTSGASQPNLTTSSDYYFKRGIELCKEAKLGEAWEAFQVAIEEKPSHAGALHSLGNLAIIINGDVGAATDYHRLGKSADPSQVPPLAILHQQGVPCSGLSDTFWVSSHAKKRLYDNPDDADTQFDVHISMGTQLEDSGLVDLARQHFRKAALLRPERLELRLRNALMVPVVYENASHVVESRAALQDEVSRLLGQAANGTLPQLARLDQLALPGTFYLVYQGYNDVALMEDIHRLYAHLYPRLVSSQPLPIGTSRMLAPNGGEGGGGRGPGGKIRVGFVSAYLRRHSVGKLFAGIIRGLPRRRFEVVVFSSTSRTDDITKLASTKARFVHVPRGFLLSNRDLVVKEELDVLVFTDIGMDTQTTMWASARLAPIQVATWGHPVTTGLPTIDYFVTSDAYEGSHQGPDRYSEQLVRFDSLGFSFQDPSPSTNTTTIRGGSDARSSSSSFLLRHGLPLDRPIISCPQSLPKMHPSLDPVWASLLAALPEATLVLLYPPEKTMWKNKLADRLHSRLRDPSQVVFLPSLSPSDFLLLVQYSRVVLDPFPFGGGVTTLETLAVCTPVVTLPSRQTVPALAAGMLQAIMHAEAASSPSPQGANATTSTTASVMDRLIAEDEDAYVRTAVELVRDATWREEVSDGICRHKHVLFSSTGNKQAPKEWAAFLTRAVEQQSGGGVTMAAGNGRGAAATV